MASIPDLPAVTGTTIAILLLTSMQIAVIARAILRPHRDPASRIAWVAVIGALPLVGMTAYLLFGETNIGSRRVARRREIERSLPTCLAGGCSVAEKYAHLARVGSSINGFTTTDGNCAQLLPDSNATVDSMVADIDAAHDHAHLLFYIWLTDENGCKVVEALKRAAGRGVACRVLADGLGSSSMIKSEHWKAMQTAGVHVAVALPIGSFLLRAFRGRIDLRNHRKIVVIDDRITYCGSQNCSDPEFRVKPKYAPWVDAVMRFEGPVARQNQQLFATDWMQSTSDDLRDLLRQPLPEPQTGGAKTMLAQVIGTGPTARHSAMPEVFVSLLHTARREVVISTPYYVPDESIQRALCAASFRGVLTTLILPARNDSWIVAAASRSYYAELLAAGVKIHEFAGGLLHAKSFTMDGEVTLIGSANMDRRSFELNYENNILLFDGGATAAMRQRQQEYLDRSTTVTSETVSAWPMRRRLWNNAVAMLGPLL